MWVHLTLVLQVAQEIFEDGDDEPSEREHERELRSPGAEQPENEFGNLDDSGEESGMNYWIYITIFQIESVQFFPCMSLPFSQERIC